MHRGFGDGSFLSESRTGCRIGGCVVITYDFDDGEMPYKKKSVKKRRKKSNHAHEYEPCVFEYDGFHMDKYRGMCKAICTCIGTYCRVCGKIGDIHSTLFVNTKPILRFYNDNGEIVFTYRDEYTKEAKRELCPETRTFPTFHIDLYKDKYVHK